MVPEHELEPVPVDAAPHLAAHIGREGDASVVRLRGALSGSRVPLAESVLHRLEKRGGGRLILDLREVSVIDAVGAAMLLRSADRMLRAGRPTTLLGSGEPRTPVPAIDTAADLAPAGGLPAAVTQPGPARVGGDG